MRPGPMLVAGHGAVVGADESDAALLQGLDVGDGRGMGPHAHVHRRCREHRLVGGQQHGGGEIVGEAAPPCAPGCWRSQAPRPAGRRRARAGYGPSRSRRSARTCRCRRDPPIRACNDSGVTNLAPASVSTHRTAAPCSRNRRISSSDLKAAMPPATISRIRLPCNMPVTAITTGGWRKYRGPSAAAPRTRPAGTARPTGAGGSAGPPTCRRAPAPRRPPTRWRAGRRAGRN